MLLQQLWLPFFVHKVKVLSRGQQEKRQRETDHIITSHLNRSFLLEVQHDRQLES